MKLISFISFLIFIISFTACEKKPNEKFLIIYCSVDEIWSAPLFDKFTELTGIKIKTVFDSEANKSVGLANRLIAEKKNPVADIYWSGEPLQSERLVKAGVVRSNELTSVQGMRIPVSYRQRVFVVNTNLIKSSEEFPRTIFDLTNNFFYGRAAMANPKFGSTLYHFTLLRKKIGEKSFFKFTENLKRNNIKVFAGNSQVVLQVANGNFAVGLTDNDDAQREIAKDAPIKMIGTGDFFPYELLIIKPEKKEEIKKFINFMLGNYVQNELHNKPPYNYKVDRFSK